MTPEERRLARNARRRAETVKRRREDDAIDYVRGWNHSMAGRPMCSFHSKVFVSGWMDAYRKRQSTIH